MEVVEIARESAEILNKLYNCSKYSNNNQQTGGGDEPMSVLAKIDSRLAEVARRRAEASGRDFEAVFAETTLEFFFNEAKIMGEQMEADPREPAMKDRVAVSEGESGEVCGVCQEEFGVGEEVTRTACMHRFHGLCLWRWLSDHNTCPICRFTIL